MKRLLIRGVGGISWKGGSQYIKSIIRMLKSSNHEEKIEVWLYLNNNSELNEFDDSKEFIDKFVLADQEIYSVHPLKKMFFLLKRFFGYSNLPHLENFILKNKIYFSYPFNILTKDKRINAASWIPDFQFKYFPSGSNSDEIHGRIEEFSFILKNCSKVVFSSEFCRNDAIEMSPEKVNNYYVFNFPATIPDVKLTYTNFGARIKYNLPEFYFYIANLFAPTKNHLVVIESLRILVEKGHNIFVVASGNLVDYRNMYFINEIVILINKYNLRNNFIITGILPREDQIEIFHNSIAVIQPSLYEGWNTSVEESKLYGKSLIVSDIKVHKEQNPLNSKFFRVDSPQELSKVIYDLWQTKEKTITEYFGNINENIRNYGAVNIKQSENQFWKIANS